MLNLRVGLGKGYGANIGYNQYMGGQKQDLKFSLTKDY